MEIIGGLIGMWLLFAILTLALAIYAIVDVARKPIDQAMKVVWVLVILAFPFLGAIASLIVNSRQTRTA